MFCVTTVNAADIKQRAEKTPDFMQTSRPFDLPLGGSQHCAPVAASNALLRLSQQGYTDLIKDFDDDDTQIALIQALGSKDHMRTASNGTDVVGVLDGLESFIHAKGYNIDYLGYQGWRPHRQRHTMHKHVPDLSHLAEELGNPKAIALANIGWYMKDRHSFHRRGGHWVTLVTVQNDKQDNPVLYIRDPSPRSGGRPVLEKVATTPITTGTLQGKYANLPSKANGYFMLSGELKRSRRGNTAILDGVVILKMK